MEPSLIAPTCRHVVETGLSEPELKLAAWTVNGYDPGISTSRQCTDVDEVATTISLTCLYALLWDESSPVLWPCWGSFHHHAFHGILSPLPSASTLGTANQPFP